MTELRLRATFMLSYEEAIEKVSTAFKAEDFGLLTHVDMKNTLLNLYCDVSSYSAVN